MAKKDRCAILRSLMICDDIRREDNGKIILIGVYPGNIGVPKLPTKIRLCLYAAFMPVQPGSADTRIEIRAPWLEEPIGIDFPIEIPEEFSKHHAHVAAVTGIPIELQKEGILGIYYKYGNEKWELISEYEVTNN